MLFRLVFKMLVFPAVLLAGLGFYMYGTTGKIPFFDTQGSNSSTEALRKKITSQDSLGSSAKQTFYKWKDQYGQWHYGDKAPEGIKSTSIDYDPQRNVVSSVKIKQKIQQIKQGFSMPSSTQAPTAADAYNPAKISQTLKDAKNIQKLIDQRYKQQQEALDAIGR